MVIRRGSIATAIPKGKLNTPERFGLSRTQTYKGKEFTGTIPAPTPPTPPPADTCTDTYSQDACIVFSRFPTDPPDWLKPALARWVDSEVLSGNLDVQTPANSLYKQILIYCMDTEANSLKDVSGNDLDATNVNTTPHTPLTENHSGFAGFAPDGITKVINTGLKPSDMSLNDVFKQVYLFANNEVDNGELFGVRNNIGGTDREYSLFQNTGLGRLLTRVNMNTNLNTFIGQAPFGDKTLWGAYRSASNNYGIREDGAIIANGNHSSSVAPQLNFYDGGRNDDGSLVIPLDSQLCFSIAGSDNTFDYDTAWLNWLVFLAEVGVLTTEQTALNRYTGLTQAQKRAVVRLVHTLDQSGDWAELDSLILHIGLGSEANSIIDMKGTQDALRVNSPSWTNAGGFTTDGSTSYINYQKNANTYIKFLRNDASCGVLTSGAVSTNSQRLFGASISGGAQCVQYDRASGVINIRGMNGSATAPLQSSIAYSDDLFISTLRDNGGDFDLYTDGVYRQTRTKSSSDVVPLPFYLCCLNIDNNPSLFVSSGLGGKAMFTGSSIINHLNIYNAIEQFKTDLGI